MRTRLGVWVATFLTLFLVGFARATTYNVNAYQTWDTALGKVSNTGEDTILLRLDVAGPLNVSKSFTLNLYSMTVSSDSEYTLKNSGTLTITTALSGCLTNSNTQGIALVNTEGATLTLEAGVFSSDYQVLQNAGTTIISGGTYSDGGGYSILNSGSLAISGGTFNGSLSNTGTFTISNGTFSSDLTNAGTLTISGGTFSGNLSTSGSLTISGGTFTGTLSKADSGSITITGGTFSADVSAFLDTENYKLIDNGDNTYTVMAYVISVDGTKCTTIAEAQAAIEASTETTFDVQLLADMQTDSSLHVPVGETINLDLNGKTWTYAGASLAAVQVGAAAPTTYTGAKLLVKDSSTGQSGTIYGKTSAAIRGNANTVEIHGGRFIAEASNVHTIRCDGLLTIAPAEGQTVAVEGIVMMYTTVDETWPSRATISGGTFTGLETLPALRVSTASATITGGSFNAASGAAIEVNSASANVTLTGCDVAGAISFSSGSEDASVTIFGGTYSEDPTAHLAEGYTSTWNDTLSRYVVGPAFSATLTYDGASTSYTSVETLQAGLSGKTDATVEIKGDPGAQSWVLTSTKQRTATDPTASGSEAYTRANILGGAFKVIQVEEAPALHYHYQFGISKITTNFSSDGTTLNLEITATLTEWGQPVTRTLTGKWLFLSITLADGSVLSYHRPDPVFTDGEIVPKLPFSALSGFTGDCAVRISDTAPASDSTEL